MQTIYKEAAESDVTFNILIEDIPTSIDKFAYVYGKIEDKTKDIPNRAIFLFDEDISKLCLKCRVVWFKEENILFKRNNIEYENYTPDEFFNRLKLEGETFG